MSTVNVTHLLGQTLAIFMQAGDLPDGPAAAVTAGDTAEVKALVAAAQAGDQAAFGALVALHERVVFRTALAALGSREDAQDAAQEAFVMAWRRLGGFRGASTFKTWLLTITWHKALDRRRARQRWWSRQVASWDETNPIDTLPHEDPTPEHLTVARDLANRARAEILRLTPKLRDALLLAVTGEHRYEDIAEMLDVPTGTVKWRVAEARRQVTARLGRLSGGRA